MARAQMRKVTVLLPDDLLQRATRATRRGITPTIRMGLEAMAASEAYQFLRSLRGKVKFGLALKALRRDE